MSSVNHRQYSLKQFLNCNTRYVVYVITCKACPTQYVGRTTKHLRDRFWKHLNNIKTDKSTNIERHYNTCHEGDTSLVSVQVV